MGSFASVVTGINDVASVVSNVSSLANNLRNLSGATHNQALEDKEKQQALALSQLQARQNEAQQDAAQKAALARQRLDAQTQSTDDERVQALRRAVARQRAAYGAQGLSSADGSSQAVLLGLFDEDDQDRADRQRIDDLRSAALDQNLAAQSGTDILQLSQLQQRQKLSRELLSDA